MKTKIFIPFLIMVYLKWVVSYTTESCASRIYCQGPVLDYIQKAKIFDDSKFFVDMKMTEPVNQTLEDFEDLLIQTNHTPSKEDLRMFLNTHFSSTSELEKWILPDYKRSPKLLRNIDDPAVMNFTSSLVTMWPELARKVKQEVFSNPEQYSLIPLPNGFIIPGGRFKETYYWDSYWIIKGLLISEMPETVRNMLDNFLYMVERFGFIPNGSRVYYLNRSQPPLFVPMVKLYMDATNDIDWLRSNIETIEKELWFWLENRTVNITHNGNEYTLARYASNSDTPRPESYFEDLATANYLETEEDKRNCYLNLKSGAESGWDFSSRWLPKDLDSNITFTETRNIIPVDLNAYLCWGFKLIHEFHNKIGGSERAKFWLDKHIEWKTAIHNVLYNEEDGIWYDYNFIQKDSKKNFYASNFAPLWTDIFANQSSRILGERAAEYFESKNLGSYEGGLPTSLKETGQQWDFPNAWPPLQSIVIFGLHKSGSQNADDIARNLAKAWINANMEAFAQYGTMFEKYNAVEVGKYGHGGEYVVQTGFGWTNGVALEIIDEFFTRS